MLGYLAGSRWGGRIYNAIHSYVTPATLAIIALLLHAAGSLPFALIWVNHIGVDRLLGYGLKYPAGFGWTHLGRQGHLAARSLLRQARFLLDIEHQRMNDQGNAKADKDGANHQPVIVAP